MALLAEEIVEEWLNRQGNFTILGIKMGVPEIDLLVVNWQIKTECRYVEVQASMRPLGLWNWAIFSVVMPIKILPIF